MAAAEGRCDGSYVMSDTKKEKGTSRGESRSASCGTKHLPRKTTQRWTPVVGASGLLELQMWASLQNQMRL